VNGTLFAFNHSSSGYTPAPGSPYSVGIGETLENVTVTNNGKFVYVVGLNGEIFCFSIQSNGELLPIPASNVRVPSGSVASVTDVNDKFLFVVSGTDISSLAIDPSSGALTIAAPPFPLPGTNLATIGMATTTPSNFLYVALSGADALGAFSFNSTGALTEVSGSPLPVGNQPLTVAVTPNAVYVVNSEIAGASSTISAFSWNSSTGALIEISGSPFRAPFAGGELAILNNQFLYVTSVNNAFTPNVNAILGFNIGSSGALTPISGSPFNSPVQLNGGLAVN
jgi:6-phosphogluconolactonase (cycloisomerase 2 family)